MNRPLQKKRIRQRIKTSMHNRKQLLKRSIKVLPHMFTLGNAFFGFLAVIFSSKGHFVAAAYSILFGALMDSLDGRVARMVKASSALGVQLDSLADAISFCFAPAFLVYSLYLDVFGFVGVVASACFLFAGILRLARFNLISDTQNLYFIGLPTTAAGCFLASISLVSGDFSVTSSFLFLFLVLIFAFLMISRIPFIAFKSNKPILKKNWHKFVATILFAFMATLRFNVVLLLIFCLYFIVSIFNFVCLKLRLKRKK